MAKKRVKAEAPEHAGASAVLDRNRRRDQAAEPAERPATPDYTRAGGHVLTDRGWVAEHTGLPVGYPAPYDGGDDAA